MVRLTDSDGIEQRIGALAQLPIDELRAQWAESYHQPAPNLSWQLLARSIAYRLQEQAVDGLKPSTRQRLLVIAAGADTCQTAAPIKPGTRLIRDLHGETHEVMVFDKGFHSGPSPIFSAEADGELGHGLQRLAGPARRSGAHLADAVGKSVVAKIRYAEQALGCGDEMGREDLEPHPCADHTRSEEGDRVDQDDHVLQSPVGPNADVFQIVALLDKADRFLDAPARELCRDRQLKRLAVAPI